MFRNRPCTARVLVVGMCLWVVRLALRDRMPTLTQYATEHGISPDTIRRAGRALLRPVLACLRGRRPGPRRKPGGTADAKTQACLACNDILKSLLPAPVAELLSSPHHRGSVAQLVRHWVHRGVPLAALAGWLSLSAKTLHRWIGRLDDQQVPHKSRRPKKSPRQLPVEIQRALFGLRQVMSDVSVAEFTRVFNRKFGALLKQHRRTPLTAKTVGRYIGVPHPPQKPTTKESPRNGYRYRRWPWRGSTRPTSRSLGHSTLSSWRWRPAAGLRLPAKSSCKETVGNKLFVNRDPAISRPYGYLLTVAKAKEREHQRHVAQETRSREDERERRAEHESTEQALRREEHQVQQHPEQALPAALHAWVKAMAGPIRATRRIFARRLAEILESLRHKLGAAYAAQLDAVRASLPALAARARPGNEHLAEHLLQTFPPIVPATACSVDDVDDRLSTRPAIPWPSNQVRGSPPDPPDTHVSGTDVSP